MEKIGFIGAYDKENLIMCVAKILTELGKKVMVIDSTVTQKMKYIIPTIDPTTSYITQHEEIDFAIGIKSFTEINNYLGITNFESSDYDYLLMNIDDSTEIEEFKMDEAKKNYFVTSFDLYSLKRGLEILDGIKNPIDLKKVYYANNVRKEDDEYLNYLSLGKKINWEDEKIYFPVDLEDEDIILENQRIAKIRLKGLSNLYKEALAYIAEEIEGSEEKQNIKKVIKQL